MTDGRDSSLIPKKRAGLKRLTDPFQVFCTEHRPEVTANNPLETVGGITSILSAMWRSMTSDQKIVYVECARRYDRIQAARRGTPSSEPSREQPPLAIPLIHVVRRGDSSRTVEMASVHSLRIADGIRSLLA
jgi:hypothetical protein